MDTMKDNSSMHAGCNCGMMGHFPEMEQHSGMGMPHMGMPQMGMPFLENPMMQNPIMHMEYMYTYYKYMCKYLDYLEKSKAFKKNNCNTFND